MPAEPITDVANRTVRTFLQGLVAAVLMGVWPVAQAALSGGVESIEWATLRLSLINAAVTAAVTFVWRRYLDPSRIPSARPAADTP